MTQWNANAPALCHYDTQHDNMDEKEEKRYTHSMSVEKVREFLKPFGRDNDIIEFPSSSATVAQAAADLNTEEGRIAKSMSFMTASGPIVIVLAGDARIDNRKFKDLFHEKARMIGAEDVERLTGHPVGGVCPFALPDDVKLYLDISLRRFDAFYPAAGSTNSAIKMTAEDLERIAQPEDWIDVASVPE